MVVPIDLNTQPRSFSATAVTRVVRGLHAPTRTESLRNWRRAVASLTVLQRPDLAENITRLLNAKPFEDNKNPLADLTIGEIGVCYEALTARIDSASRKAAGQYFTPDDAARFMAEQSRHFPEGVWLDPCCGVGNLAWHLAAVQEDPANLVRDRLVLIDRDETALLTAVSIIAADFLRTGDNGGFEALRGRAVVRDFLSRPSLPPHDYTIVNPPYARSATKGQFRTANTRENFSYFVERIARNGRGFIAVTPASYLSAPKFRILRDVLNEETNGGRIFVFDNVPDTLFKGYKFGSSNTSNTNFVRACITVCAPDFHDWSITPIIRWRSASRSRMFDLAPQLLAPRKTGPANEWAKLPSSLSNIWDRIANSDTTIADLVANRTTDLTLTVGLTPRYYISASYRELNRGSKAVLHFDSEADRDRAAILLNSSIPYIWWRALDGGVTLPKRVLMSTPVPEFAVSAEASAALAQELRATEAASVTTKLNAGLVNENVKRDPALVRRLTEAVLGEAPDLQLLYSEDMPALTWHNPSCP